MSQYTIQQKTDGVVAALDAGDAVEALGEAMAQLYRAITLRRDCRRRLTNDLRRLADQALSTPDGDGGLYYARLVCLGQVMVADLP